MKKKYDKQKTVKFLYEKGNNISNRKLTYPKDHANIILPCSLDFINLGVDMLRGDWIVRVRFSGSQAWFEVKLASDKATEWFDMIKHLADETRENNGETKEEDNPW